MFAVLHALGMFIADLFKSRWQLDAENLFLRHQLNIALRHAPARLRLCGADRAMLIWMMRIWPGLLGAARVIQPETILRWHRCGFNICKGGRHFAARPADVDFLGHKRTFAVQYVMSALPPKADMCSAVVHVCFGPIADITFLFDDLISAALHRLRYGDAEHLGGL